VRLSVEHTVPLFWGRWYSDPLARADPKEALMSLEGIWKLTIAADDIDPEIVPGHATMTLIGENPVTGKLDGPHPMGEDVPVVNFIVNGDAVSWHAAMRGEKLRAQELDFVGTLTGSTMSGEVEVGIFGTAQFTATKT
jgi:hypothetical protein